VIHPAEVFADAAKPDHAQINNNRRAESQETGVDKEKTDAESGNAHDFPQPGADTKKLQLKKFLEFIHKPVTKK
jgi:hypothetical protein